MQAVRDFLLTDALEMKLFLKFPEHMAAIQRAVSASDFGQVVQEVEELQHAYVLKHHVHKIKKADPWMVMTFGFGAALYTPESSWARVAVLAVTAVVASAGIIWDQKGIVRGARVYTPIFCTYRGYANLPPPLIPQFCR
jgi:hypothetical protein